MEHLSNGPMGVDGPLDGVWLAYSEDWTQMAAFGNPVEASDHAEEHGLLWAYLPFGETFGPGTAVVEGLIGGP